MVLQPLFSTAMQWVFAGSSLLSRPTQRGFLLALLAGETTAVGLLVLADLLDSRLLLAASLLVPALPQALVLNALLTPRALPVPVTSRESTVRERLDEVRRPQPARRAGHRALFLPLLVKAF